MTTSCWDDVVFTEKTFRVISCGFEDGGFEEFRNLGFRGTEGLEVDFEVTRAHVETSPLWRLLNWGIEYFQRKKNFVWFRVVSWMEDLRNSGILGLEVRVQSSGFRVLLRF